ncbi:hypothetical protein [Legionella nagasakiensis]|uniref:hypothetical protein n=1 Tax=Legionella nagasakiensis TaxID=535290 RepID=UPI001055FF2D|nr:hypothetical protein [Legionella nagasakiensis]
MVKRSPTHPTSTSAATHRHAPSEGVWLETKNGRKVELTATHLEQWFAKVEAGIREDAAANKSERLKAERTSPGLIARYASQYGFKNPEQLVAFLKSPAGETTKEVIGAQIAETIALQQELQQQLRDEEIRRHRLMAFLLLYFLSKRDAKAQELKERIQEEIDKLLQEERTIEKASTASPTPTAADYEARLAPYRAQLANSLKELETLDEEMNVLEAKTEQIVSKYLNYATRVTSAEEEIHTLLNGRDLHALKDEEKPSLHADIDRQIAAFTQKMETNALQIQRLVDESMHDGFVEQRHIDEGLVEKEFLGRPLLEAARAKIEESTADNLHIAALKDLKSVLNGEKVFCARDGELVSSVDKAELVLPKDMAEDLRKKKEQLVEHEGKFYLIKQGQDIRDLSTDEKQTAHEACKRLRPEERVTVKHLIQHNSRLEHQENNRHKDVVLQKQQLQVQKVMEFANAVAKIQAERANQATLEQQAQATPGQQPQPSRGLSSSPMSPTPPRMTPLPTTSAKTAASPAHAQVTKVLQPVRHALPQEVIDVLQKVPNHKMQLQLAKLKAGEPIPDQTWQALMKVPVPRGILSTLQTTMERFAAGLGKPILDADKEHTAAPRPDPLSTNPFSGR